MADFDLPNRAEDNATAEFERTSEDHRAMKYLVRMGYKGAFGYLKVRKNGFCSFVADAIEADRFDRQAAEARAKEHDYLKAHVIPDRPTVAELRRVTGQ